MATRPRPLLNPPGPAQSEYLIHFCGRPPGSAHHPTVPQHIRDMTPVQRLDKVLTEGKLRGFAPFGAQTPVLCFSESPPDHLAHLIAERHWVVAVQTDGAKREDWTHEREWRLTAVGTDDVSHYMSYTFASLQGILVGSPDW